MLQYITLYYVYYFLNISKISSVKSSILNNGTSKYDLEHNSASTFGSSNEYPLLPYIFLATEKVRSAPTELVFIANEYSRIAEIIFLGLFSL